MPPQDPPELHVKLWPITVTAKGRDAITAVRRPLIVMVWAFAVSVVLLAWAGRGGVSVAGLWLNLMRVFGQA